MYLVYSHQKKRIQNMTPSNSYKSFKILKKKTQNIAIREFQKNEDDRISSHMVF